MNNRHLTAACAAAFIGVTLTGLTVAGLSLAGASKAYAGSPRAVVELFTSQGCSSCPPADRLMGELAHDPSLIVMSLPVDYWDYLGWKDTLALHGHSLRQRAYSVARGDREVYTPQAVVNGVVHVLGSDKAAIEKAIASTDKLDAPLSLPVAVTVANGTVMVTVQAAEGTLKAQNVSAEIWLCPLTANAQVVIGRGENSGRTLTYHNVARRWVKLGVWTGKAETFSLPLSQLPDADFALKDVNELAVIVQSGGDAKPGLMLGAATVALR
ncbi:MAG: DUF1223 domain-containing protein [Rhodopseudomonas sp.]|nr:DUF1223 domain-containing protein [Rhodopseudomonas sp.]